jgi:hypothetical protein
MDILGTISVRAIARAETAASVAKIATYHAGALVTRAIVPDRCARPAAIRATQAQRVR